MTIVLTELEKQNRLTNLQRWFGQNLDAEVLKSILEINDWDVQLATQFLEIQNNDNAQVKAYEGLLAFPSFFSLKLKRKSDHFVCLQLSSGIQTHLLHQFQRISS